MERWSLVLATFALVLLIWGTGPVWRLRWLWLVALLALPLPVRVEQCISLPLQRMATAGAQFLLELAGVLTLRDGNILHLDGRVDIAVVEVCSGLRMLTAFTLVAGIVALMIDRPDWQRALLLLSSIPLAVIANILRLVATGGLALALEVSPAGRFHDAAGLAMMPFALALVALELWLLSRLVHTGEQAGAAS